MTNQMTVLIMFIVLVIAAMGSSNPQEINPVRGFAGYEYDSGIGAIQQDMATAGYTLIDQTDNSLWYDSSLLGIDCQLGYIFEGGSLIGGAMILSSVTQEDFSRVNNYLREVYKTKVNIDITDGVVIARIRGPDSLIIQRLNLTDNTHEVEYTKEK